MQVELTRELKGIYRPSQRDKRTAVVVAVGVTVFLALLVYSFRVTGESYLSLTKIFCSFLLVALLMDVEVNLRTVTVDDQAVAQRSPLGIYRQRYKHQDLSGIRVTRMSRGCWGNGGTEVCYRGQWIFFGSNRTFRQRIDDWATHRAEDDAVESVPEGNEGARKFMLGAGILCIVLVIVVSIFMKASLASLSASLRLLAAGLIAVGMAGKMISSGRKRKSEDRKSQKKQQRDA